MENPQSANYSTTLLPRWVHNARGQVIPFDRDAIAGDLFAATELLGQPDPFLANELTHSVVFFLRREEAPVLTTAQVAEAVTKVIQELGHGVLVRAFHQALRSQPSRRLPADVPSHRRNTETEPSTEQLLREGQQKLGLSLVFSRDLQAAVEEGFLSVLDPASPFALGGCVWGPPLIPFTFATGVTPSTDTCTTLLQALENLRNIEATFFAVDSWEHLLPVAAAAGLDGQTFLQLLRLALPVERKLALNLNVSAPPPWSQDQGQAPLFASELPALKDKPNSDPFLREFLHLEDLDRSFFIHWHLRGKDRSTPRGKTEVPESVPVALEKCLGKNISFPIDRRSRASALGPGLDRDSPVVLTFIAVQLPRLLSIPGTRSNPEVFLQKVGHLVHLAVVAAKQKRNFLKAHRPTGNRASWLLHRYFLLDRAPLVVIPVGLEFVVRELCDWGLCEKKAAVDLCRQILSRMRDTLKSEGAAIHLNTRLGGHSRQLPGFFASPGAEPNFALELFPGISSGDPTASLRTQLEIANQLQEVTDPTATVLVLPKERILSPVEFAELTETATACKWVTRLELVRVKQRGQPNLPGF